MCAGRIYFVLNPAANCLPIPPPNATIESVKTRAQGIMSVRDSAAREGFMQVHPAELADLNLCHQINGAYTTDYVWQMQTRGNGHRTEVRFDKIRLPRSMQVEYPRSPDELLEHWQQDGCFLVARNLQNEVVGFIDAQPQPWQNLLWIANLVVEKRYRRRGIATQLIKAAGRWAAERQLHTLMLEVQTKNYPAIAFAQKLGFQFCGYNERYYTNGDITLYFFQSIR
jgi:ribosomal protein S18 acetylase RimI-like enzyme